MISLSFSVFLNLPVWASGPEFDATTVRISADRRPVRSVSLATLAERYTFDPAPWLPLRRGTGAGLLLPDGRVITNHHVVAGAVNVGVHLPETEKVVAAQWVFADPSSDVAVLQTQFNGADVSFNDAQPGQTVWVADPPDWQSAIVERINLLGVVSDERTKFSQLSVTVEPGDSGGPVLNEQGQVVGIITAVKQGRALMIPAPELPLTGVKRWGFWGLVLDGRTVVFDVTGELSGEKIVALHTEQLSATSVSAIQALLRRQQIGAQVRVELEDRVLQRTASAAHELGFLGACLWQGIALEPAKSGWKVVGFHGAAAMELGLLQGDVIRRSSAQCPRASSELTFVRVLRDQSQLWIAVQPQSAVEN